VSTLPRNLALVADDLAKATQLDLGRARRRRRLVTYAVAFALLALTAGAAVGSGWLFNDETPVVRVVPGLAVAAPGDAAPGRGDPLAQAMTRLEALHRLDQPGANGSAPLGSANMASARTLISGLGARRRTLSAVTTTTGGVCLTLTDLDTECFATFAPGQDAMWLVHGAIPRLFVVWGLVREDVTGVEVVSAAGTTIAAALGNGGFYAELADGPPAQLLLLHDDGSSDSVTVLPCPVTTPDCDS
jgi:hypothetical protein